MVFQARREDQDPGEKSQRSDRGELYGSQQWSLTAGQGDPLFTVYDYTSVFCNICSSVHVRMTT